jgi:hypothetical protein
MRYLFKMFLLLSLFPLIVEGQSYFNKSYPSLIPYTSSQYFPVLLFSVQQTDDGGYLSVGSYADTTGWYLQTIKTNELGDTIKTSRLGEYNHTYSAGYGGSLFKTIDNMFSVCGVIRYPDLNEDGLLLKLNSFGDTIWSKTYGDSLPQRFRAGCQNSNGEYYLAGYYGVSQPNNTDMWLLKADSLGNILWSKRYGGLHYEEAVHIAATNDGGFLLSGMTNSWTGGGQNYDLYSKSR